MPRIHKENNFFYFTVSLVMLMLVSSIDSGMSYETNRGLAEGLRVVMVGVAFWVLPYGRRWKLFSAIMVVLLVVLSVSHHWMPDSPREFIRISLGLVFDMIVLYLAGRQVLTSGDVSTNTMVGALAVYLLLGMVWAGFYMLVLFFQPDAFNGIQVVAGQHHYPEVLYFSFVTLTTLGYGDISPAIQIARTLVYLEATAGAFYLAIVVASLVSARSNQRR